MPVAEFNGFSIIQVAFPNALAVASSRCELFLIYRGAHVVKRIAKRGKCVLFSQEYTCTFDEQEEDNETEAKKEIIFPSTTKVPLNSSHFAICTSSKSRLTLSVHPFFFSFCSTRSKKDFHVFTKLQMYRKLHLIMK